MKKIKFDTLLIFIVCNIFLILKLQIFTLLNIESIYYADALWFQTTYHQFLNDGIFNISKNIAYPFGFNFLTYQTLGVLLTIIPIGLKIFGISSAALAMNLALIIGINLNAIAFMKLSKLILTKKIFINLITISILLSPFSLGKLSHIPPAHFYFVPFLIYLILKVEKYKVSKSKFLTSISFLAILSPQWWVTVALIFLLIYFLIGVLVKILGIHLFALKSTLLAFFATIIAIPCSYLIERPFRFLIGNELREPWQSNKFGGTFTDLLVGSPLINNFVSRLENLALGASPEANISKIGTISIVGFTFILVLLIIIPFFDLKNISNQIKFLIAFEFILLLTFITGGFGNLQAAFFVLFGETSPARSWSRLSIVIASFGLIILFYFIERTKIKYISIILFLLIPIQVLDAYYTKIEKSAPIIQSDIYPVVKFLESNYSQCGVLQLPLDKWPVPFDFRNLANNAFYYKGFQPYIMSNDLKWSFGNWEGSDSFAKISEIPIVLDKNKNYPQIVDKFCVILFDKYFADWMNSPTSGLEVLNFNEVYSDERYSVFEIN